MVMKDISSIPPRVASEFAKAPRPTAVADATATGYTKTKPMAKAQQKSSSQFGLPKSGGMKAMKMKG